MYATFETMTVQETPLILVEACIYKTKTNPYSVVFSSPRTHSPTRKELQMTSLQTKVQILQVSNRKASL